MGIPRKLVRHLRRGEIPSGRSVVRQLNRAWHAVCRPDGPGTTGVDVFEEDWDNLVILDACRADVFRERADLPGETQPRTSRGSMTAEWVRANFAGRALDDTVYVAANGHFARLRDELDARVHEFVGVWQDEYRVGEGNEILRPETVTKHALDANERHPDKRLLVHYVQPHYPFIGPTGQEHFDPRDVLSEIPWKYDVSRDLIRRAYEENLDVVLDEVERLLPELQGKTVVSADHGELLGERVSPIPVREYGHPRGIYVEELLEVPWHVYQNGPRKEIVGESPRERPAIDEDELETHLRDLGYTV